MSVTQSSRASEARADVETLWTFHVMDSGPVTVDMLLVLGSHDLRVADRAAQLYIDEHAAPLIAITGGAGKVTQTEWSRPEAEIYADRLTGQGVPRGDILVEPNATNTGDNFEFTKRLLQDQRRKVGSAIVVCKPYMARRSLAVAGKRWADIRWFVRPPQIGVWEYPTVDVPLGRMINLMVGDLQRLRVYAERGFQLPVEIPAGVWSAYERLAARGFDQFVVH
jgi:uncharacterized SAM-binding protein YcdF (DUF218 family)